MFRELIIANLNENLYATNSTVLEIEITDTYKELSFYSVTASSINWGDNTENNLTSHTYTQNGTYIVELKGNTLLRCTNSSNYTIIKLLHLSNFFANASYMFFNCKNLKEICCTNWDTSNIISFYSFVKNCIKLNRIHSTNWNTSSVTNFNAFASGCTSLQTLDVSNWDTSNVTSFYSFIQNCYNLTNLDVSNWDTSSVTNFNAFASGCTNLTNLDVSNWNTSNVTNFDSSFRDCTSIKILDFSSWVIRNNIIITNITYNCISITEAYAIDQTTCDKLNETNKPNTWQFVVKPTGE